MAQDDLGPGSLMLQLWKLPPYMYKHLTMAFSLIQILLKHLTKTIFKRKKREKGAFQAVLSALYWKGACKGEAGPGPTDRHRRWSEVPCRAALRLPPSSMPPMSLLPWMEPVLVWRVSC